MLVEGKLGRWLRLRSKKGRGGYVLAADVEEIPDLYESAVREAIGRSPDRPAGYDNIEKLPQRCEVMDADAAAIKAFIAKRVG